MRGVHADFFEELGSETEMQGVQPVGKQILAMLRGMWSDRNMVFKGHHEIDLLIASWEWGTLEAGVGGNILWGEGIHAMKLEDAEISMPTGRYSF